MNCDQLNIIKKTYLKRLQKNSIEGSMVKDMLLYAMHVSLMMHNYQK